MHYIQWHDLVKPLLAKDFHSFDFCNDEHEAPRKTSCRLHAILRGLLFRARRLS